MAQITNVGRGRPASISLRQCILSNLITAIIVRMACQPVGLAYSTAMPNKGKPFTVDIAGSTISSNATASSNATVSLNASPNATTAAFAVSEASDKRLTFTELLIKSESDKFHRHHYERYYTPWLDRFRDKKGMKILEIGADQGRSLKLRDSYFSDADSIVGLAYGLDSNGIEKKVNGIDKVSIITGDQSSNQTMKELNERGPWDVIIDDGSHFPQHVTSSFQRLWNSVAPGGLYIAEDMETSYWPNGDLIYGYALPNTGVMAGPAYSAMAKFMELSHILVRHQIGAKGMSIFQGDETICSIEFGMNIVAVRKCGLPTDGPGPRYLKTKYNKTEMTQWLLEARRTNPSF